MSFSVKKVQHFLQKSSNDENNSHLVDDFRLLGGVLKDSHYVWQAKGPVLEVRNTKTGQIVGAWIFGGVLKDSNTKIVCVDEIERPNGHISLLVVGLECAISGGVICIFDIFSSKVIRAINIEAKVSSVYVVDPGVEDLNLPGPLRNFDGILAVGTEKGNVILVDLCKQICEESLLNTAKKDELDPSQIVILTTKHVSKIEQYKEGCVRDDKHLAFHLNVVEDSMTDHFVLKGPKGEDRIHVNKEEVVVSALYYCAQLTSLLIGYNFGSFQLWDLTNLKLIYTSPVCEEHIPITNFALQEPTDDPRAFCYIWVSYSNMDPFQRGLPFAVMYALSYESKEYHEGYGYFYQDFNYCNIRFQMELGSIDEHRKIGLPKGGYCLGIQPITKHSNSREYFSQSTPGDTIALCMISWSVWFSKSDTQTCFLLFDLNQWYKEQMPSFSKWKDCNNYILRDSVSDLIWFNGQKPDPILSLLLDEKSLKQFSGVQKLEEHFYPTSFSFNLWVLRKNDVVSMFCEGLQRSLLAQIIAEGPLCLVNSTDLCNKAVTAVNVGLMPLFVDVPNARSLSLESQREIILNIALEHRHIGWLCKCASEWANGSFSSAGCSLDFLINWAFQRAIVLKSNCDKFCSPLFDYSQSRLDANTSSLLNSCTKQISGLCELYKYILQNLSAFVNCLDLINEHYTRLEMVSIYFEVIQWLVNVGLLPECHPSTYPRPDNSERISAPYPVQELTEFYKEKRAELRLHSRYSFESSDSILFIDNLIDNKCGGSKLQAQWQEDGGSGLYPPPSLQSLVRTYLVDGANISHKHSLILYLFLDLAMVHGQNRYSSIVTHLIKFPAVFKVSPSIIKITQAFWQLDHGGFDSAMDYLLDPFVLSEDLQPWHHSIAMRSLLINKQPNNALLYLKIRKPPIIDEKDVMIAISLFVANNMLDEAIYFKKKHQNNNDEKLLMHLLNECRKNDTLHLLLYKRFNVEDEKTFIKFLKSARNSSAEDLQIYYYLLRFRFIEAFDTHSHIKKKYPDRQGLIGQSEATDTDQIVKIFKNLLPDVNKNLVEYIRKERSNLWKEVQRPTPMSVFVHDNKEKVQYKSTLIHAALAKAKHTFQDTFTDEMVTEEIPFLRTPTVSKKDGSLRTTIITPKIIDIDEEESNSVPSPSKRRKLNPRLSTNDTYSPLNSKPEQITVAPIVKRKTSLQFEESQNYSNINICTPQSILKVRNLVDDSISESISNKELTNNSLLHSTSLRLQSRPSISNTPKRQHVQFDKTTRFSSSLSDQSGRQSVITPPQHQTSSKDVSSSDDVEMIDDVFYSPDNSGNKDEEKVEIDLEAPKDRDQLTPPKEMTDEDVTKDMEISVRPMFSPSSRRSINRTIRESSSPIRSSPRLSKLNAKPTDNSMNESQTSDQQSTDDSESFKSKVPKLKKRKSLSRQVLEHNTFIKQMNTIPNIVSKEVTYTKSETVTVTEKSFDKVKTSTVEKNIKEVDVDNYDPELSTTSKTHSSSTSERKENVLQVSLQSDLSIDSLQFEESNLQESSNNSLQQYIDDLLETTIYKDSGTKPTDNQFEKDETNEENEKSHESINDNKSEEEQSDEVSLDKQDKFTEDYLKEFTEDMDEVEDNDKEEVNDDCFIVEPTDNNAEPSVFATLTPVQEEMKFIYEDQMESPFDNISHGHDDDEYFDEFAATEDCRATSPSESTRSSIYDIPVAEKGFLDGNDVITISDEENSKSSESVKSDESFHLNISNDDNDQDSRESIYSKTTEENDYEDLDNNVDKVFEEEKQKDEQSETVKIILDKDTDQLEEKNIIDDPSPAGEDKDKSQANDGKEENKTKLSTSKDESINFLSEKVDDQITKTPKLFELTTVDEDDALKEGTERIPYSLRGRKVILDDPTTTSSSDTTEGEISRKEIVTAQIHTPNTSKNRLSTVEIDLPNTSKAATNVNISVLSDNDNNSNEFKPEDKKEEPTPVRRTRRSLSTSDTPSRTRLRRLSSQDKIDLIDQDESLHLIKDAKEDVVYMLRKRSMSVDEVRTFSKPSLKRNKSTSNELIESNRERRTQMPVISEELETKSRTGKNKSDVSSYTSSRRLTRQQANIVKDITEAAKKSSGKIKSKISLDLEETESINLPVKGSFEDKADEETKVYEPSSPSTSLNPANVKKRRSRSRSVLTEGSISSSDEPVVSRIRRATRSQTKSPIATGVSTRSRKHSEASSVVSEQSESESIPSTRSRKKKLNKDESVSPKRSTRARSNSVSSEKSSSSRKVLKVRRVISAKNDLPEISEEKVEEASTSKQRKKQTKKKP